MKLIPEQKRFVREHFQTMSVREMAGHLGVEPKDVRWAMAELGLVPREIQEREEREGRQRSRAWRKDRWRKRLSSLKRATPGFLLVTGLALVLRLVQLALVVDEPLLAAPTGIGDAYHQWGLLIAQGDWLSRWEPVFYHSPAYAYLLGLLYSLAGPSPVLVGIVQAVLSAATAGLTLLLGRRIFGPVSGLVAGLLAAGYGMFVLMAGALLPETLIVFLSVGGLVALVGAMQRPHPLRWLWAGLVLGLAVTARGPLILFLPLAGVAVATWFAGRGGAKRWVPACLLIALGAGLAIAPVTLHNRLLGGRWVTLTASVGPDLYTGNHRGADGMAARAPVYKGRSLGGDGTDRRAAFARIAGRHKGVDAGAAAEVSRFWIKETFKEIGEDKYKYFSMLLRKIRIYFSAHESPADRPWASPGAGAGIAGPLVPFGAIVALSLLGLIISIRGFKKRGVLVWFVLAHLVGLLVFWVDARHRLVVVPVLLVYAAAMTRWLWQKAAKRSWLPLSVSLVAAVGLTIAAWLPLPDPPPLPPVQRAAPRPAPKSSKPGPVEAPDRDVSPPAPSPPPGQPGSVRLTPPEASVPE